LFVEDQHSEPEAGDDHLPEPLGEQAFMDAAGYRKIGQPVGLGLRQQRPIHFILADRLLQVAHGRRAEETLDLHDNPPTLLLGRDRRTLRAEIDEQVFSSERERQRVVSNRPAVGDERSDDVVMIEVLRGHWPNHPWRLGETKNGDGSVR
jgi:hypothetical protein